MVFVVGGSSSLYHIRCVFWLFFRFAHLEDKTEKAVPNGRFFSCLELLFVCLPFSPKRIFSADKLIWGDAIVVLNRLDDGLLVTLLTKKVVVAQPLFLIDRHWKYKYLTCQKTAMKSVTKVLNNWFVRIDYAL